VTRHKPRPNGSRAIRRFFRNLGPGLITGAADDDPSGIATYSVTGAAFGYSTLWTALFSFPLMAAVQLMCARLGMVTGRGLGAVLRRHYPRWVLWGACVLLAVANLINIGADLGGMGEATAMVTGISPFVWTPIYAVVILVLLIRSSYRRIAGIFKWLTLVLFAYVVAAWLSRPDWGAVLQSTLLPHFEFSRRYLAVLVAILGTSISPYLFFWQAAEEVEEERAQGRKTVAERKGATPGELRRVRNDVIVGMGFSNLIMYFIIMTTTATLHARGVTDIGTAQQAAEALRPLAGDAAYLLFTLGIVGTGMLAVPVLAGSSAYAIAEGMAWAASLDETPRVAAKFYVVFTMAVVLGMWLTYLGLNAVQMLFWSAILNGVLAPPLIFLVVLLTANPEVMGKHTNPPLLNWMGWLTGAIMSAAAVAMFLAR
jgi:NRAMP (natural resistance-associated macrophage protein)-like metal ion transporter